MRFSAKP